MGIILKKWNEQLPFIIWWRANIKAWGCLVSKTQANNQQAQRASINNSNKNHQHHNNLTDINHQTKILWLKGCLHHLRNAVHGRLERTPLAVARWRMMLGNKKLRWQKPSRTLQWTNGGTPKMWVGMWTAALWIKRAMIGSYGADGFPNWLILVDNRGWYWIPFGKWTCNLTRNHKCQ